MKDFAKKNSTEQAARIASILSMGLLLFGVDLSIIGITDENLTTTIFVLVTLVAEIYGYLRRVDKGDVTAFGARK